MACDQEYLGGWSRAPVIGFPVSRAKLMTVIPTPILVLRGDMIEAVRIALKNAPDFVDRPREPSENSSQ
jgi:hypothetical protein